MSSLSDCNIGLIFGTDTGNTEEMGDKICTVLSEHGCAAEMINVEDTSPEEIEQFDFLIMGIPTWDFGGIQDDWAYFEEDILRTQLQGKVVALYGMGDQLGYGDNFVDAMGWLHERVVKAGAQCIGFTSTGGYDFAASLACNEDKTQFCGLAIDDDQQFDLTDDRISNWIEQLVQEYSQLAAA